MPIRYVEDDTVPFYPGDSIPVYPQEATFKRHYEAALRTLFDFFSPAIDAAAIELAKKTMGLEEAAGAQATKRGG